MSARNRVEVMHGVNLDQLGRRPAAVTEATSRDKKRTGEAVPYVLVQAPGRVTTGHAVGAPEVLAAVRELSDR